MVEFDLLDLARHGEHNAGVRRAFTFSLVVLLAACGDSAQQEAAYTATERAVADAICAQSRDDLEAALGSLAIEAAAINEPEREDAVVQIADEVVCTAAS